MKTTVESTTLKTSSSRANAIFVGVLLVLFGVMNILARFFDFNYGFIFLPGIVMLAWGIYARSAGWMIPAGILNGIGLGLMAQQSRWAMGLSDIQSGGIFLVAFALGWFSIALFTSLFTSEKHVWALIPGTIMALIGAAVLSGTPGLEILKYTGYVVPVGLIIAGLAVIFKKTAK